MSFARAAIPLLKNASQRKHLVRWLRSLKDDYCLNNKQPWLVFDALDYLQALPLEGRTIFEYGSGGSTLYWLSRNMRCISVEHDPRWYEKLTAHLKGSGKIDYRLVQAQRSAAPTATDAADPLLYQSGADRYRGENFEKYVRQIDDAADGSFDVVSIDGRARASCIMHSAAKVKVGGMLLLDDADRPYYTLKTGSYLRNFRCVSFNGYGPGLPQTWATNVYVRER